MSAQLLAAAVTRLKKRVRYVDAIDVMETDGEHGNATPRLDDTTRRARKVIAPLLTSGNIVIVPGYIGRAPDDSVATLGYGAGVSFAAIYNPHDVTLVVVAVPEAQTWAMLLAGLGWVGVQLRRRGRVGQ